jgi:hypothetical protein
MKRHDPTLPAELLRDVHQLITDGRLPSRFPRKNCRHAVATLNWSHFLELLSLNQLFQREFYAEMWHVCGNSLF